LITASTSLPEARPWWQVMQRASPPRFSTLAPDGNVTDVRASAAGVVAGLAVITVPVGRGLIDLAAALPSPPR
jgi:hypothetical protein